MTAAARKPDVTPSKSTAPKPGPTAAQKATAKQAAAKKLAAPPTKFTKQAADPTPVEKVPTAALLKRVTKALEAGFGVRQLNELATPGTTTVWAIRRGDAILPDRAAKFDALLKKIESGAIKAPERVAASVRVSTSKSARLDAVIKFLTDEVNDPKARLGEKTLAAEALKIAQPPTV